MNNENKSVTHKFNINGCKGYFIIGLNEKNKPYEIFIKVGKKGSTLRGLLATLALTISLVLQADVPLETLILKYKYIQFDPSGETTNIEIPVANSIVDYLAKYLEQKYL